MKAVQAGFIEIKTSKFTKKVNDLNSERILVFILETVIMCYFSSL